MCYVCMVVVAHCQVYHLLPHKRKRAHAAGGCMGCAWVAWVAWAHHRHTKVAQLNPLAANELVDAVGIKNREAGSWAF